ncbi:MAG TPA: dihydrodipicolinate synthase family protein [Pseudonocardiaceae bacterium]
MEVSGDTAAEPVGRAAPAGGDALDYDALDYTDRLDYTDKEKELGTIPLRGIVSYMVTPLDDDMHVDERATRRLVERLIESGVDGLSPLGFVGETTYATGEQKRELVRIVVDQVAGRVPVVPGVLAASTSEAAALCEDVRELGAAGIVAMCQTWGEVTQDELVRHFARMAASTDLPVTIYRQPALGATLDVASIGRLAALPNVCYLKDASGKTGFLLSVQGQVGDAVGIFAASAHIPALVLQMGGLGWMSGPACVIPATARDFYRYAVSGAQEDMWKLQRAIWPLCSFFGQHSSSVVAKTALAMNGMPVGPWFEPQTRLHSGEEDELRQILSRIRQVRREMGLDSEVL